MQDQILVLNSGSSSLKVDVFSFERDDHGVALAEAMAERVGTPEIQIQIKRAGNEREQIAPRGQEPDAALECILDAFLAHGIFPPERRLGIGHRVVHGGARFTTPVRIDATTRAGIETCSELAPLHNPANLAGIDAAMRLFPMEQVAVFDTAFHASMPEVARTYAIPFELAGKHGLRRYGFHGSSHAYVGELAAGLLGRPFADCRIITLHLGNGASACAIHNGQSVDTSMGFTPLEGLVMGTRSGDIDPALVSLIGERENLSPAEVETLLNRKSGLLGLSGKSDMRDLLELAESSPDSPDRERARLARDVFCYRIRKYVGAYLAVLNGADALVFTGGIGENAAGIRARCCEGLAFAGIQIDPDRNANPRNFRLSPEAAPTAVFAIPTDEERHIARQTRRLLRSA
ncbi:MAG: acetate kinase [Spirochaetales bacterium]|nr:acetate kinase [Spirochaetales bacterium]